MSPLSEGLAFVNDWGILSNAIENLKEWFLYSLNDSITSDSEEAIKDILEWVPKLIDSWSELWELSLNLVALVEAQKLNETPAGIYLPETAVKPPTGL